jgi:hypothetical protein
VAFAAAELLPEERDRPALEGKNEEEVQAVELDDDQGDPKNGAMSSVNGNPQQEDADAALEEEVRSNVSRLASPPPLHAYRILFVWDEISSLAGSILDTQQCGGTKD